MSVALTRDARIAAAVESALAADPSIDSWSMRVDACDGVVRLAGETGSFAERHACRSIAVGVPDVVGIVDDLTTPPFPGDTRLGDAQIVALVAHRLARHPELAGIRPTCFSRVVSLAGDVERTEHRRLAHHLTRTTRGVHVVDDDIAVTHPA